MIHLTDEQRGIIKAISALHGPGSVRARRQIETAFHLPGKRCCACKEYLEIQRFGRNKSMADGRQAICRGCMNRRYGKQKENAA